MILGLHLFVKSREKWGYIQNKNPRIHRQYANTAISRDTGLNGGAEGP